MMVVGTNVDPRVWAFRDAAERLGVHVDVVDWTTVLAFPEQADGAERLCAPSGADFAEVLTNHRPAWGEYDPNWFPAFDLLLGRLRCRPMNPPRDVAVLCDKNATLARLPVRVPRRLDEVSLDEPACVKLPDTSGGGPMLLTGTPLVATGRAIGHRLVRTPRPWRPAPDDARALLRLLLASGARIEERIDIRRGAVYEDYRVVVIAGRARHRIARRSAAPVTNLEQGGQRHSDVPDEVAAIAEQAMTAFPDCHYAGVDVGLDADGPVIFEINAFGDYLPGVLHEGEDTHTAQLRAWWDL